LIDDINLLNDRGSKRVIEPTQKLIAANVPPETEIDTKFMPILQFIVTIWRRDNRPNFIHPKNVGTLNLTSLP